MAEAICHFIFTLADDSVCSLENKEDFKETAVEFNKFPRLKRLFDIYIISFWQASVTCELHYEHDDCQEICKGIEVGLYKSLEAYEETNQIHGLSLKDFVKGQEELVSFKRECTVGEEARVSFKVLLDILLTRRFFDYQSTLPFDAFFAERLSRCFWQHVFGKEREEDWDMICLEATFGLMLASTDLALSEYIIKIEEQVLPSSGSS